MCVCLVASTSLSQASGKKSATRKLHECGAIEKFDPAMMATNCAAEAAAYARALMVLAAAQQGANDAWEAWNACELEEDPIGPPTDAEFRRSEQLGPSYSILE
jgi:hypothetical protein